MHGLAVVAVAIKLRERLTFESYVDGAAGTLNRLHGLSFLSTARRSVARSDHEVGDELTARSIGALAASTAGLHLFAK